MFYADNGRIPGRNPIWVQMMLTTVVRMFERVGLQNKLGSTKSSFYTPGPIWGKLGVEAYKWRETGEGAAFRERKKIRLSC